MIKFKKDFIQRDTGKNILLIGNGFDLAAGLKTRFIDLLKFVVMTRVIWNYKNVLEKDDIDLDKQFSPEDYNVYITHIKKLINDDNKLRIILKFVNNTFFKKILKMILPKLSDYIYIEFNASEKDVQYRANYIYGLSSNCSSKDQVFKLVNNSGQELQTFISSIETELENNNDKINLWLDTESLIELAITGNSDLKEKYGIEDNDWVLDGSSDKTKEFYDFVDLFEKSLHIYFSYIPKFMSDKSVQFFDNVQNDYLPSLTERYSKLVCDFDINNPDIIINYNYTSTATNMYGINDNNKIKEIHINGSLDRKLDNNDMVIGFSDSYSEEFKENLKRKKDFLSFKKMIRRVIKNCPTINLKEIMEEKFNLIIMGHSCGMADSDILSRLLNSENLNYALVLCYDKQSLASTCNNICAMVGLEKFESLIDVGNSDNSILMFALHNKK